MIRISSQRTQGKKLLSSHQVSQVIANFLWPKETRELRAFTAWHPKDGGRLVALPC